MIGVQRRDGKPGGNCDSGAPLTAAGIPDSARGMESGAEGGVQPLSGRGGNGITAVPRSIIQADDAAGGEAEEFRFVSHPDAGSEVSR